MQASTRQDVRPARTRQGGGGGRVVRWEGWTGRRGTVGRTRPMRECGAQHQNKSGQKVEYCDREGGGPPTTTAFECSVALRGWRVVRVLTANVTCPGDDRVLLTANSAMVTRTGGAPWKATCAAPGRPREVATGSDGQGMNARIEPTAFCTCTMLGGGGAGLVVQNQ